MSKTIHPTVEQIELFVLRAYDQIGFEQIEDHLASCSACAVRLQKEATLELGLREVAAIAEWCPRCGAASIEDLCPRCGVALRPGGYVVEEVLDEHPMGRTYRGRDADGGLVRINELVFQHVTDHGVVERFEREVQILRQLAHPGIPTLITSFREGDDELLRLYAVETFVEGTSLDTYLETHRMTEAEVKDIALQVLDVLVYLQTLSPAIFHRDIRPRNLLRRADGRVMVRQFTQARDLSVTGVFTLVGQSGYIPTEQHVGVVDKTSDLFGLGASLVHLLTRRAPMPGALELDRANVSSEMHAWISRLTAAKQKARFPSAEAARQALLVPDFDVHVFRPRRPSRTLWLAAAVLSVVAAFAAASVSPRFGCGDGRVARPHKSTVAPPRVGVISIETKPPGAAVRVDGRVLTDSNGGAVHTPLDVRSLRYGGTYALAVELDGYHTWTATLAMNSERDGTMLHPDLRAVAATLPAPAPPTPAPPSKAAPTGRLTVDVVTMRGLRPNRVEIRIDGRRIGFGPRLTTTVKAGRRLRIDGHSADDEIFGAGCEPRIVTVAAGARETVEIDCRGPGAAALDTPNDSGCVTKPNLPTGFATISTQPYSTIYWDGRQLGTTPLSRFRFPSGCVTIRAVREDGSSKTVNLEVHPNRVGIYRIDLR